MPIVNVALGSEVRIAHPELVNLFGCTIGDESTIGPFVEIQANVQVGKRCKIQSHSFICEGVTIGDGVFVGHGVMFTNDRHPRAIRSDGELGGRNDWTLETTIVESGASIGSGAVILPGVIIGANALIGAGAVVTCNVQANSVVVGNPARVVEKLTRNQVKSMENQTKFYLPLSLFALSMTTVVSIIRWIS
jgi:UDP-2-acetamido-3-amino-2,3-dideoxy-glucuronate N-acetyltransferase